MSLAKKCWLKTDFYIKLFFAHYITKNNFILIEFDSHAINYIDFYTVLCEIT